MSQKYGDWRPSFGKKIRRIIWRTFSSKYFGSQSNTSCLHVGNRSLILFLRWTIVNSAILKPSFIGPLSVSYEGGSPWRAMRHCCVYGRSRSDLTWRHVVRTLRRGTSASRIAHQTWPLLLMWFFNFLFLFSWRAAIKKVPTELFWSIYLLNTWILTPVNCRPQAVTSLEARWWRSHLHIDKKTSAHYDTFWSR